MNHGWKGLLGAASATVVTVALATGPAEAATQGWWSTEGYTVTNSGYNPNETALTVSTVAGLKLNGTRPDRYGSAPVLDKGRVFLYTSTGVIAYDEETGKQLWLHQLPDRYVGGGKLVVTGGKLVVAFSIIGNPVPQGVLQILDAATGTKLSESRWTDGFSQVLVDKDVVIVSGQEYFGVDTHAYSLTDGKLLWYRDMFMYQPVSANGRILLQGVQNGAQYSEIVDMRTGKVVYSVKDRQYRPLAATPDGAKFYVAWGHSLQLLDAATGKLTWVGSNIYPTYAAVSPTRIYVTTRDGGVLAVDLKTGKFSWQQVIPNAASEALGRPILAGGVLYVTFPRQRVYTFNPVNGAPLNTPAMTGTTPPPVVTKGRVYVTDGDILSTYTL